MKSRNMQQPGKEGLDGYFIAVKGTGGMLERVGLEAKCLRSKKSSSGWEGVFSMGGKGKNYGGFRDDA